jgi:Tol biopolymer transport system component
MKRLFIQLAVIPLFYAVAFGGLWQAAAQSTVPGPGLPGDISPRNRAYSSPHMSSAAALLPERARPASGGTIAAPGSPAQTAVEPDAERYQDMVYQSYRDGNWEIYVSRYVNDIGSVSRLTTGEAYDGEPRLNPGCTRVVFSSDRDGNDELYTMDTSGNNVSRLTWNEAEDYAPSWSADGLKIAFVSRRDGNDEIYSMRADGSALQRLTFTAEPEFSPAFSPDGAHMAWVRAVDDQNGIIFLANPDGSRAHAISPSLRFVGDLAWSSDSTRLAFDYDSDGNGWNELGSIRADGTGLTNLYNPGTEIDALAGSWSIKGVRLYFSRITYRLYEGKYYIYTGDIYNYFPSSGGFGQIYANNYDFYPDVQPNDLTIPVSKVLELPPYSRASEITLPWEVNDPGRAGWYSTEFQYRYGTSGDWTTWNTMSAFHGGVPLVFTGQPGQTGYFRSRAVDLAEHWEAWPEGDGDAFTTFFTWLLKGRVTDSRNLAVPGATVSLSPAGLYPSNTTNQGDFLAYLTSDGPLSLSSQHAGYGALPDSQMKVRFDTQATAYLPPETNWLANGGFESQPDAFTGWMRSSVITPSLDVGQSGSVSARLGPDCTPPCLGDSSNLVEVISAIESAPLIRADAAGNLHVLFDNRRYMMRSPSGSWSEPVTIGNLPDPGNISYQLSLAIDQKNGLHAVVAGYYRGLYYYYKPAGGAWGQAHELTQDRGQYTAIAVNRSGVVVVAYAQSWDFYITRRSPEGVWSAPEVLGGDNDEVALAALPDGSFRLLAGADYGTYMWKLDADGALIPGSDPISKIGNRDLSLVYGPDGRLHALGRYAYSSQNVSGTWSEPVALPGSLKSLDMAISPDGTVHLFGVDAYDMSYPVYYLRMHPGENGFSQDYSFNGSDQRNISVALEANGKLAVLWNDYWQVKLRESTTWPVNKASTLSTSFNIPAGAHRPTLAFMLRMKSNAAAQPFFKLSLRSEMSPTLLTTVFSTTQDNPWKLAWADLGPWAGQTVTATFSLSAPAGTPATQAWVDSISVGEWWTPQITQAAPLNFEAGAGGVITLTGDNFPITPTVSLGSYPLTNLVRVDPHTLQASLPANIPTGFYDLLLAAPGGQVGSFPKKVEVGHHIFLPMIEGHALK